MTFKVAVSAKVGGPTRGHPSIGAAIRQKPWARTSGRSPEVAGGAGGGITATATAITALSVRSTFR